MSELAARHLMEQGALPIYVTNRTWARAQELARALSGTAVPFNDMLGAPYKARGRTYGRRHKRDDGGGEDIGRVGEVRDRIRG